MTPEDAQLLKEFAEDDSQAAFTAVVDRYVDFVYAAALRQLNGDSGLASDVTQAVFIDLARKARSPQRPTLLPAWLHRATRLSSLAALRAQQRRIAREIEAVRMQEIEQTPESADWNSVKDAVDEAIDQLNEKDREVVLLRFFQKQSFREMSSTLRLSEDAARMRVERALDKLRGVLAGNGITSTGAALSAALTAQSALAAPSGLSLSIAQAASAAAAHSSLTSLTIMATTKLKLGMAAALAAGAIAVATHEHLARREFQNELTRLGSEIKSTPLRDSSASERTNNISESAAPVSLRDEHLELMRLRGEVSTLRKAKEEAEKLVAKAREPKIETPDEPADPEAEAYKTIAIARMNYTRGWGMAFIMFAEQNGRMPKTFAEAASHYPKEWASVMSAFDSEKFEIVFNGSLKELSQPERTIIVRETLAFSNPNQPGFARTYLFADGHTEIHSSPDGHFEDWERGRLVSQSPESMTQ